MNDEKNDLSLTQMADNAAHAERLLKQLANRNRLMVLCHLVKSEMSVSELSEKLDISQSALSQHLAKLRDEHLVSTRKQGQQVIYRLASMEVNAILSTLYLIYCR